MSEYEEGVPDESQEPGMGDADPYPDGTVGMLMRQRDDARASARVARIQAERYLTMATEADARATALSAAIIALGGEPEEA